MPTTTNTITFPVDDSSFELVFSAATDVEPSISPGRYFVLGPVTVSSVSPALGGSSGTITFAEQEDFIPEEGAVIRMTSANHGLSAGDAVRLWDQNAPSAPGGTISENWYIVREATKDTFDILWFYNLSGTGSAGSWATHTNGAMLNPTPVVAVFASDNYNPIQGFHFKLPGYRPSLNWLSSGLPKQLNPGDNLILSHCVPQDSSTPHAEQRFFIRRVWIIHCVSELPPANSFGPSPFADADQTPRQVSSLNLAHLAGVPSVTTTPLISNVSNYFASPHLDCIGIGDQNTWISSYRSFSGGGGGSSGSFGRDVAWLVGTATLICNTDFDDLSASPLPILYGMVQYGIDLFGAYETGGFWPDGGAINYGRKWPILFAGTLLGISEMTSLGRRDDIFCDDSSFFTITTSDLSRTLEHQITGTVSDVTTSPLNGTTRFKIVPSKYWDQGLRACAIRIQGSGAGDQTLAVFAGDAWNGYDYINNNLWVTPSLSPATQVGDTIAILGYQPSDIGRGEWGIRHGTLPQFDSAAFDQAYRESTQPYFRGIALSVMLMNLRSAYDNDDYLRAAEWYHDSLAIYSSINDGSPYHAEMWEAYWTGLPDPPAPTPSTGASTLLNLL